MSTVGGAISGYCATASSLAATSPARTMTIAMTAANTGRWMKKRDMVCRSLARRFRLDRHARAQADDVVDDHRIAGLQALEDHPAVAEPLPDLDLALRRLAFGAHQP